MHPDPQPRAGATGARFKSSPDASRCAPDLVALHPRPHLSPPSSPPPPMIPIRSVSLRRSQRCAERHNLLRKWRILKQKWHKSLAGLRPAPRDKMTFRLGARPDLRNTHLLHPTPNHLVEGSPSNLCPSDSLPLLRPHKVATLSQPQRADPKIHPQLKQSAGNALDGPR